MNIKQYMIVDLEKRNKQMFITDQVSSIRENKNGLWSVQFSSSTRVFNYNRHRLLFLTHPETINIGEKGFYIKNRHITNVSELLRFTDGVHTFYHVSYNNGYYENFEGKYVYVTRTPIDKTGGSTWDYLQKLAAETGLQTEDAENILSKQYELVDVKRDNVPLAQYLGDKTQLTVHRTPKQIYYPFGCNASQKKAVEAALTHQVSIIQGPPGTGKTQTILNIISNLLITGKTVLIVSNNNSAVDNVAEKLEGNGLGFIVAKLGSVQNKETFIANQSGYPDTNGWKIEETAVIQQASVALQNVTQGFDGQIRQAQLKAEYDALLKETKYNEMLHQEANQNEWLQKNPSSKLMSLLNAYQRIKENGKEISFWFRLKWSFSMEMKMFAFLCGQPTQVIKELETAYYISRKTEIEQEMERISSVLQSINIQQSVKYLRSSSLQLLKSKIAKRYANHIRKKFTIQDIKFKTEEFLNEYPVVLSTTYSAKSCISKDMVFDYVIMDEASQVDIKTGALALSCAMNAVIVGDDKQLPNVVSREEAQALNVIQTTYSVSDSYNAITHSFLQSCVEVFKDAPVTLLREHYRCHPKIIEFCNQRFYHGELIAMTTDNDESNVLQVVRTAKGNHARDKFNQREVDVIVQEVIPEYRSEESSMGIITPYRLQADEINKALGYDIASTVHKYQGRECDTIIMSTVDNTPTEFSDDANLLNVAISRAKTHLCIVTSGNEISKDTNLAQLIAYIQYNNFEVKESKLHSVFDLLYKQYTSERLAYEKTHSQVSEYLSENLMYNVLLKTMKELGWAKEVLCHYPLSKLVADWKLLNEQEKTFAESPFSHVDFLVYNSLTKEPIQIIEVDGWHFHEDNEAQQARDIIKNAILTKLGIRSNRISTTTAVNAATICQILQPN